MDHASYLRTETIIGFVINAALGFVSFAIVFGLSSPIVISGVGNYAFDF